MRKLRYFFLAAALIGLAVCSVLADADATRITDRTQQYEEANRQYEAGNYAAAADLYESILKAGNISADVLYNLGVAKHRLSEDGESVLWMKRALIVQPGMPEATQSLTFLRNHLGLLEFADEGWSRFLAELSPAVGPWIVSLCLWIAALSAAAAVTLRRLQANRTGLLVLAVLSLVLSIATRQISHYRAENLSAENFWTITETDAKAVAAPMPEAASVIPLPIGSEVRVLQNIKGWCYVDIPGDIRGWVRKDALTPTWPIPTATLPQ